MSTVEDAPPQGGASPRGRGHTARNAAIAVGAILVGFVVLLATRGVDEGSSTRIVGQAAPEFRGETLDGETFNLAQHRGEWVVVNFFAQWCTPCRVEHPEMKAFVERHRDDPVQLVSVAFDDQADKIREFFAEAGGDWPVLANDTGRIALDYGVNGVPESYVVAPNGQVVGRAEGVTADELDSIIEGAGGLAVAAGGSGS
jgi:thiol-disulfide isomerase/thioredoxin